MLDLERKGASAEGGEGFYTSDNRGLSIRPGGRGSSSSYSSCSSANYSRVTMVQKRVRRSFEVFEFLMFFVALDLFVQNFQWINGCNIFRESQFFTFILSPCSQPPFATITISFLFFYPFPFFHMIFPPPPPNQPTCVYIGGPFSSFLSSCSRLHVQRAPILGTHPPIGLEKKVVEDRANPPPPGSKIALCTLEKTRPVIVFSLEEVQGK